MVTRTTLGLVLLSVVMIVGVAPGPAGAAYASGGLGLSVADWEATHGPGQAGQTYVSYQLRDGVYNVGSDGLQGAIFFIERTWNDPAGVPLTDAQTEAKGLIPGDATLLEHYDANSAKIGYGTDVARYRSPSLAGRFSGQARKLTGNFVVVYEKIPAPASLDAYVTRMTLVVGTKP